MKKTFLFMVSFAISTLFIQAQVIDVTGIGVRNQQISTLYFENLDNIEKIIVEAVYKDSDPITGPVTFTNFEGDFQVNASTDVLDYDATGAPVPTGYFSHTFFAVDESGITLDQESNLDKIHSFIAYVYRLPDNPDKISFIDGEHVFFYRNNETTDACGGTNYPMTEPIGAYVLNFPIPLSTVERDVTVYVPVSEMALDSRDAFIELSDGVNLPVVDHFYTFNQGNSFYLNPLTLTGVPGDVSFVTVRIWSPCDEDYMQGGDSFITSQVVVSVTLPTIPPPPDEYCTLTQGFYGNKGGKFNGYTTTELLEILLEEPLVIGKSGDDYYSFTIETPDCILFRLPGGGPADALTADDEDCTSNGYQTHKKGEIKNILLAQTITLGLNLRLDINLGDLELGDLPFGNFNYYTENTIQDLYDMANEVLGGMNSAYNLGDIAGAIGSINDYFDECRNLGSTTPVIFGITKSSDITDQPETTFAVYPNPVGDYSAVEFTSVKTAFTTLELYNVMGTRVQTLFSDHSESGQEHSMTLDATSLPNGVYILVLRNGDQMERMKFSVQ